MSLVDRTRDFSSNIIKLHAEIPAGTIRFKIGDQLLSAGTSPAAHFRESLRAGSKAEYVAKLNGGLMELEETLYWLELLIANNIMPDDRVQPLRKETTQLIAIFVSLIKKWSPKAQKS
jgi:four helix bundle protein